MGAGHSASSVFFSFSLIMEVAGRESPHKNTAISTMSGSAGYLAEGLIHLRAPRRANYTSCCLSLLETTVVRISMSTISPARMETSKTMSDQAPPRWLISTIG